MKIMEACEQKKIFNFLTLSLSLIIFFKSLYLINGNILNAYPFLSSDSFDYIVEALALKKLILTGEITKLEILRNPLLVSILTIDNLISNKGFLISIVIALSYFYQFYFSIKILNLFKKVNIYDQFIIFISIFFFQINGYKVYILSENICIFLLLAGSFYSLDYYINKVSISLKKSFIFTLFGILGQTYVAIPILCIHFFYNFHKIIKLKITNIPVNVIIYFVSLITIYILVKILWNIIPHNDVPSTFILLGFIKEKTVVFYFKFWTYYFTPVFLLVIYALSKKIYHF